MRLSVAGFGGGGRQVGISSGFMSDRIAARVPNVISRGSCAERRDICATACTCVCSLLHTLTPCESEREGRNGRTQTCAGDLPA